LAWLLTRLRRTELREAQANAYLAQQKARIQLMAKVFEHSGEAIMITDANNRIVDVNRSFTETTGYSLEDVRNKDPKILAPDRKTPEEYEAMWHAILHENFWHGDIWHTRKDDSTYPARFAISTVRGKNNAIENYIGSFTDISEQKAASEQIHHLAHHDVLTGLANRLSLYGRLEQALATARRTDGHVAVLFIVWTASRTSMTPLDTRLETTCSSQWRSTPKPMFARSMSSRGWETTNLWWY
jgi:PAS domain S-box-containing protein